MKNFGKHQSPDEKNVDYKIASKLTILNFRYLKYYTVLFAHTKAHYLYITRTRYLCAKDKNKLNLKPLPLLIETSLNLMMMEQLPKLVTSQPDQRPQALDQGNQQSSTSSAKHGSKCWTVNFCQG